MPEPDRLMNDEEEVIALTRVVAVSPRTAFLSGPALPARSRVREDKNEETHPDIGALAAEIIGEKDSADRPEVRSPKSVTLPLDQLEQALEKVVKKLYSGVIESMVLDVMEKNVQREIDKIKALIADAAGKEK
jgi:hypothetical protein